MAYEAITFAITTDPRKPPSLRVEQSAATRDNVTSIDWYERTEDKRWRNSAGMYLDQAWCVVPDQLLLAMGWS